MFIHVFVGKMQTFVNQITAPKLWWICLL